MKNLAAEFLPESDKEKITNAVKKVETITSGEIVPMVVSSSYHYPVSNIIGAFILSMIISLAMVFITGNEDLWLFLAVFIALFTLFHWLIRFALPLKRMFITESEINEEVEEAAITAFYRNGLSETRDKTGVLIFISVFERKVRVLADSGINEKVPQDTWQRIVDMIVEGIKRGEQGEYIVKAVLETGEILKTHFPVREGDKDELDNLIVEGD